MMITIFKRDNRGYPLNEAHELFQAGKPMSC